MAAPDVRRDLPAARRAAGGRVTLTRATTIARLILLNGLPGSGKSTLARPSFAEQLEELALATTAGVAEVVLAQTVEEASARLERRASGPMDDTQRDAHRLLTRNGWIGSVPDLHAALGELVAHRPRTVVVRPIPDDVEGTYRTLLHRLDPSP